MRAPPERVPSSWLPCRGLRSNSEGMAKNLLIVDDEEAIRFSFSCFFEDRGWSVRLAESGEQALEIMSYWIPDAAIVDVRMGGVNGPTFIQRAYPGNEITRYVLCTGSPEFVLPEALRTLPRVIPNIFRKPVFDLHQLENILGE